MAEKKQVWFFYRHDLGTPYLYAYTEKRKLAESFENERNKKIFIKKEKELSKEQWNLFQSHHGSYRLERRGFETGSDLFGKQYVYLVATAMEELSVITKADTVFYEIAKYTMDMEVRCFRKELLRALADLYFFELNKFRGNVQYISSPDSEGFLAGVEAFNTELHRVDQFGLFMYLYGSTLDKHAILSS